MRDDFTNKVKEVLARRVNYLCSNPECQLGTVGPHSDDNRAVNKGVAAHIAAASPGGKRHDPGMTVEERTDATNGIWLCQNCAKLIDSDELRYTASLLRDWKAKAEASVQQSLQSNSPLVERTNPDLRVNACYVGGLRNSRVQIGIFNASPTPIYIASWFASFGEAERGPSTMSYVHSKGRFPIRLQGQDRTTITVIIEDHPLSELRKIGVVDGNGRWWESQKSEVQLVVQKAKRYASLQPTPVCKDEVEEQLKSANVEISAAIRNGAFDRKRLEVQFVNRSEHPITLRGAEIKWEYDPPRSHPDSSDSNMKVSEIGGTVGLTPNTNLKSPVEPGGNATFYLPDNMVGVLVETILGDVNDKDIVVHVYTDTCIMWSATEDEIPETVREFARYVVATAQART